jgi:hypothetical protein
MIGNRANQLHTFDCVAPASHWQGGNGWRVMKNDRQTRCVGRLAADNACIEIIAALEILWSR